MDIQVDDDPAARCAEILCEAAEAGQHIALTGGSTPGVAYEWAAGKGADWSRATLWWGDERCVPPDDELSNFGLAKRSLLDRIEGEGPEVHRMRGERGPHVGADDYENELRERLGELAESMQGAQKVAWADNAIKLAVDMTVAAITRINLQGSVEQQADDLRQAMSRLFPEAVTLVREAREGFGT